MRNSLLAILLFCVGCSSGNLVKECEGNLETGADAVLISTSRIFSHFEGLAGHKQSLKPYFEQAKKSQDIVVYTKHFTTKLFYQLLDTQIANLPKEDCIGFITELPSSSESYIKLLAILNNHHYINILGKNVSCSHCSFYRDPAYQIYGPIQFDYEQPYLYGYEIINYPYDSLALSINQDGFKLKHFVDSVKQIPIYKDRKVYGIKAVRMLIKDIKNKQLKSTYKITEYGYTNLFDYEVDLYHYAK